MYIYICISYVYRALFQNKIYQIGIGIANSFCGMTLIVFLTRALHILLLDCWSFMPWQRLRSYKDGLTWDSMRLWQLYSAASLGDQTISWYPTLAHYPDTELTSPCSIRIMPSAWLGSDKYKYLSHWFDVTRVLNTWIQIPPDLPKQKMDAQLIWPSWKVYVYTFIYICIYIYICKVHMWDIHGAYTCTYLWPLESFQSRFAARMTFSLDLVTQHPCPQELPVSCFANTLPTKIALKATV